MMGFIMTAESAAAFFELCIMREAVKEEERIAILQELVAAGKAEAFSADASKDEIIKALAEHYKVLKVSKRTK